MDIPTLVAQTAVQYGVDPSLALGVAAAESNFNPNAVSSAGAIGVMQLEPGTAVGLGVNPYDVAQNIQGGVRYLAQQLARFGDVVAALAAYDWGPGAVANAIATYGAGWLSHAPGETQNYVAKITGALSTSPTSVTDASGELPPTALPSSVGWGTIAALAGAAAAVVLLFG